MKQIEQTEKKEKDLPLATMVIKEYKELNRTYVKTIKKLTHIIIILLVLLAVATTYIVLCWESVNPHTGLIREDISE